MPSNVVQLPENLVSRLSSLLDPASARRFRQTNEASLVSHLTYDRLSGLPGWGPKTLRQFELFLEAHGLPFVGVPSEAGRTLYSKLARYPLPDDVKTRTGLLDTDELVAAVNTYRMIDKEWPLSQAEFPSSLTRLRRVVAEYELRAARDRIDFATGG